MDEQESMSMTTYYGCMHAFVNVFMGEMAMVRDLVVRLEGQDPLKAFGWQTALDRARNRATLIVERWRRLNETFEERVSMDEFERRVYGQSPASATKAAQTARELVEMLGKFNSFIDGLQTYDAEDVRLICGMADEMVQSIGEETKASSLVAAYLDRGTPDAQKVRPDGEQFPAGLLGIEGGGEPVSVYFHTFFNARDDFRAELDQ
jgi:hypothetical protein